METNESTSKDFTNGDSSTVDSKTSMPSLLEQAQEAAKKLEEQNKKREELLNREEEMFAKKMIAGRGELNVKPPERPKQDILHDEINVMFKQLSPFYKK